MSPQGDAVKKTPRLVSRETTLWRVFTMFHVNPRSKQQGQSNLGTATHLPAGILSPYNDGERAAVISGQPLSPRHYTGVEELSA